MRGDADHAGSSGDGSDPLRRRSDVGEADLTSERSSLARRSRRRLLAALLATVGVALGLVTASGGRSLPPDAGGTAAPSSAAQAPPPLPVLRGSGDAATRPSDRPRGGRGAEGASADRDDGQAAKRGGSADATVGGPDPKFTALLPGAVEDRIAAGSPPPYVLPRSYLVGRIEAFGVRDASAAGPRAWSGVVRVEHDPSAPSEAREDTEDPATTAVRGRVVAEDGRPVAGATVVLWSCFYVRQSFYDHRVSRIGRVTTDRDGAFDVRPIAIDTVHFGAGGELLVSVHHPAYPDLVAQALSGVVPGRESDVGDLTLPARGVTLHGVVRDLAGRPVAGAVVRVSGLFDPVACDKTERMVVLDECPAARTDAEGRYAVAEFAAGVHEVSVHVRLDCVVHVRGPWAGDAEWSPRIQAGNSVRGRVVDPSGEPVATAVVVGGGNWTPTNADGTFWLDNVLPGPLRLEVWHHTWHTRIVAGVPTNGDDVTIALERPLSRVVLTVLEPDGTPAALVAVDWTWPPGGGPSPFTPVSRYWQDPGGAFALVVPEGAMGATVSDSRRASVALTLEELADGTVRTVPLVPPAPPR